MFHLEEAKQGSLVIYRYAWQPLSYELGAAIYRLTHAPALVFLLAPICGAASLALLLAVNWRDGGMDGGSMGGLGGFLAGLIVLLAIPELWYCGLYYSSTVLGLPFAVGAYAMSRSRPAAGGVALAGLLVGIAILMRLDFLLACPALAWIAWQRDRSPAR